jgi:hypothetical protein
MGLGLSYSDAGEIKPYVKYDARAGRLFRMDRVANGDGTYSSDPVDITNAAQFVADLGAIRVGWIAFTQQGPQKRLVTLGTGPVPERPGDLGSDGKPIFKQGFELDIVLGKAAGGGPARVFGHTARCVVEAIDALHDAYMAAPEAKSGQLPVVRIANTVAVKSGQSTNYKPVFEISGWVARPAGLDAAPRTNAPATGSTHVAPPAPAPVAVSADDFG